MQLYGKQDRRKKMGKSENNWVFVCNVINIYKIFPAKKWQYRDAGYTINPILLFSLQWEVIQIS